MTNDLISRLKDKTKNKIAVWYFTDLDDNVISIGKYISEQVSVDMSNSLENFILMERGNLVTIMKEHKLNADGFIDQNTAKQIGQFAAVDFIITGKITVLSDHINLTMKFLNTETAMINASVSGDIPMNANIKELLGLSSGSNQGFNGNPINPNEHYNNPGTVAKECETKNTGDYIFENKTANRVRVRGDAGYLSLLYLGPGETGTYYSISAGKHEFQINIWNNGERGETIGMGEFMVEKCTSKSYIIR
ncbi:MAG: FlgO family outer membrane protein [Saprospiraceae bacterium]